MRVCAETQEQLFKNAFLLRIWLTGYPFLTAFLTYILI
jgi:hypothetical protein